MARDLIGVDVRGLTSCANDGSFCGWCMTGPQVVFNVEGQWGGGARCTLSMCAPCLLENIWLWQWLPEGQYPCGGYNWIHEPRCLRAQLFRSYDSFNIVRMYLYDATNISYNCRGISRGAAIGLSLHERTAGDTVLLLN